MIRCGIAVVASANVSAVSPFLLGRLTSIPRSRSNFTLSTFFFATEMCRREDILGTIPSSNSVQSLTFFAVSISTRLPCNFAAVMMGDSLTMVIEGSARSVKRKCRPFDKKAHAGTQNKL